jgi:HSP20 family protein
MSAESAKVPVQVTEKKSPEPSVSPQIWQPFESLRHEVERLFDNFDRGFFRTPFRRSVFDLEPVWRRELTWAATPAVDIVEKDTKYEITAELPGLDEKSIEVKVSDGGLIIKGEKQEEKEEKKKDYYLHERHFGSFERSFRIPDSVDADRIEATFKKGVLTLSLPKKAEAQKPEKKIEIKAS